MQTITKEFKVYTYDELNESSKENVQEYFAINNEDIENDYLEDDFSEQIKAEHPYFINPKFQWRLSYSQGDGLSFKSEIDIGLFLDIYYKDMKLSVYDAICNVVYNLRSEGNTGNYCYASKHDIDYKIKWYKQLYYFEEYVDKIVDYIKDIYLEICEDFEKQGYKAHEYLRSDEYARETCDANDFKFTEDGSSFN